MQDHDELPDLPAIELFKAFSERARLRVLGVLAEGDATLAQLCERLQLSEDAVLPHLGFLRSSQLVTARAENKKQIYSLNLRPVWDEIKAAQSRAPEVSPDDVPDAWERDIINRFFEAGKLKSIPMQQKKRRVVLNHIAREFHPRAPYPETLINETLRAFHPDCASLRRYLVDDGIMTRTRGMYRLIPPEFRETHEHAENDKTLRV